MEAQANSLARIAPQWHAAKGQKEGEIATGHKHEHNEGDGCKTTPNPQ
jgi:hypothetical protein